MSFILERAVYPNHVCCRAVYPDLEDVNVIKGIRISDVSLKTQELLNSYKIYLSDTIIESRFTLAKQIIIGDQQIKRKLDCVPPWITDNKVTQKIYHDI